MQDTTDEIWHEAGLSGFGRVLRLGLTGLLLIGTVVLFFLIDASLRSSWWILSLLAALMLAGIYDIFKILRTRIYWNDSGIRKVGLFGEGRLHKWEDLTHLERSMHHRATVLTFKRFWKVRVYWSYGAHREIVALAKARLKESKPGWLRLRRHGKKAARDEQTVTETPGKEPSQGEESEVEAGGAEANGRNEPTLERPGTVALRADPPLTGN